MNDLQTSGIAGLVTGSILAVGGFILDELEPESRFEAEMNQAYGHGLKITGGLTAAAGVALLGIGTILGGGDSGSSGVFDAVGMP